MKTYILAGILGVALLAACREATEDHAPAAHTGHEMEHAAPKDTASGKKFWCPMDTQVVQKTPGTCPICKMDLEPIPGSEVSEETRPEGVYAPVNAEVLSSVRSIKPVSKSVPVRIKANGYIRYDDRRIYNISAKVGGRIEKLFVKYNYQPVQKGQPLFEVYSHELQDAQQDYMYILRTDPDAAGLLQAARRKLLLKGMTEAQVSKLHEGSHVHATTTVYSPYSGFVIEVKEQEETVAPQAKGMGGNEPVMGSSPAADNKQLSLREGAYVDKGQTVFTVANTDIVWAVFEVHSPAVNQLNRGQQAHIVPEGRKEMIMGKIDFIEPAYKETFGTARFRVYLPNKEHDLKINDLVTGEIEAGMKEGLWIPWSAVYDLGTEKVVFVKKNGAFETRSITTGYTSGQEVEVTGGVAAGEEIAANAQFMVDSESFIKVR